MVKPVLIIAGTIPVIFAILLIIPLTNPEIPITAIDPNDIVEIEFTKHHLTSVSFGITERLSAQQTEILVIKNDGELQYTLVNEGSPSTEKISLRHSYNSSQIEWFKAGSALNVLKNRKK